MWIFLFEFQSSALSILFTFDNVPYPFLFFYYIETLIYFIWAALLFLKYFLIILLMQSFYQLCCWRISTKKSSRPSTEVFPFELYFSIHKTHTFGHCLRDPSIVALKCIFLFFFFADASWEVFYLKVCQPL
jgi:hypothetical protein